MPPKRRKFQRPLGERRYRKLFVIAVEGVRTEPQYFALSNPKFEYWLLLHFNDGTGTGIASSRDCSDRLKRHLPGYDKGIDARKLTRARIDEAVRRARLRDNPPCADWPRAFGGSTVYKLVERILRV